MRVLWTVLLAIVAAGLWAALSAMPGEDGRLGTGDTIDRQSRIEASAPPASAERAQPAETTRSSELEPTAPVEAPRLVAGAPSEPVAPVGAIEAAAADPGSGPPAVRDDSGLGGGAATTSTGPTGPSPAAFVLRGRGVELDPFRPTWDLLRSAERTSRPAEGTLEIPPAVALLDGQVVSITGYFAAGIAEEATSELLVMFNRWDGCCLGLPPSPFDSVEVKLREPVVLRGQHMIRYGTITGRFEIEPFLVADWLIGLYRLVDAKLEWGGGQG